MSDWAALVYARTLNVDFRFIAVPKDFTSEDLSWIEPYILTTTRLAETLPDHPRWSLIRNDRWCVLGITCTARELVSAATDTSMQTMIRDQAGRPLYLFAAYVLKAEEVTESLKLPRYKSLSLGVFAPLYAYVRDQWPVKDYEDAVGKPILTSSIVKPVLETKPEDPRANQNRHSPWKEDININQTTLRLFPDDENTRIYLWNTAITQQAPVSLCLGLTRQIDAEQGCFLNATVSSIQEPITLKFPTKQQITPPPEQTIHTKPKSQPVNRPPPIQALPEEKVHSSFLTPDLATIGCIVGSAIVGATIGGAVFTVRIGMLMGAAVGGVVGLAANRIMDGKFLSGGQEQKQSPPSEISFSDQENLRVGLKKKGRSTEKQNLSSSATKKTKGDQENDSPWKL